MREHAVQLGALVIVIAAVWLLRRNAWRARLYFSPSSLRIEEDAPADARVRRPDSLLSLEGELLGLQARYLGTHVERPAWGPQVLCFDYLSGETFASLFVDRDGMAKVELLTPLAGSGFVRTASHRRSAFEAGNYFSGYLENVSVERLLAAHQRRVAGVGTAQSQWDLQGRVAAGQRWTHSPGALRELRQLHQSGLVWAFGAVVSLVLALLTVLG